jgi:uncharacterized protein
LEADAAVDAPISDLRQLLAGLSPRLNPGRYVFVTLPPEAVWERKLPTLMRFLEAEGCTLIMAEDVAVDSDLDHSAVFAWITLEVHSDLNAVGLTAAIASALAKRDIACNMVAGFHHDHAFVPYRQAQAALDCLNDLSAVGV